MLYKVFKYIEILKLIKQFVIQVYILFIFIIIKRLGRLIKSLISSLLIINSITHNVNIGGLTSQCLNFYFIL